VFATVDRDPTRWPTPVSPAVDPAVEAFVTELMSRMSLEQKVGQVIQAELRSVTPDDILRYHIGSVLNGGGSTHNIGLGAADDPGLMREIGAATALEMRATGLDWTFAPTLAVVRDDRWGRTYEGYSEDPRIVARYAAAIVDGLQGTPGGSDYLGKDRIVAPPSTSSATAARSAVATRRQRRDRGRAGATACRGYPPAIAGGVHGCGLVLELARRKAVATTTC
jgi:beta-glucosidase